MQQRTNTSVYLQAVGMQVMFLFVFSVFSKFPMPNPLLLYIGVEKNVPLKNMVYEKNKNKKNLKIKNMVYGRASSFLLFTCHLLEQTTHIQVTSALVSQLFSITLFISPTSHPIGYHFISSVSDFPSLIPYINKLEHFKRSLT